MGQRYHSHTPTGRSATLNPARASLPNGFGYSSSQSDSTQLAALSARPHSHITPVGYSMSISNGGTPTTTRKYSVTSDPRSSHPSREGSRMRRSTLDSAARPPVIVTTMQDDRTPAAIATKSTGLRSGSPVRDDRRLSNYYTQPASTIRSRSSTRPYHYDDHPTYREFSSASTSREVDAYHAARPTVIYPSNPRRSPTAIDYGDDGYIYTNAGELVKYDLDHPKPSRSRRHDSFDRGYYKPFVGYPVDQRTSTFGEYDRNALLSRGTGRHHEVKNSGPPPSVRGLDKINREAPLIEPTSLTGLKSQSNITGDNRDSRRRRPVSVSHDVGSRNDHRRTYEDDSYLRGERQRELEPDRRPEHTRFQDDGVGMRGFGIRTEKTEGHGEEAERYKDSRKDELWRPMDDSRRQETPLRNLKDAIEVSQRGLLDERQRAYDHHRTTGTDASSEHDHEKIAAGLGAAAIAALTPNSDTKRESGQGHVSPPLTNSIRPSGSKVEQPQRGENMELPPSLEKDTIMKHQNSDSQTNGRQDAAAAAAGGYQANNEDRLKDATNGFCSESTGLGHTARRQRSSKIFDPNDTSDLKRLKEQLTAMQASDKMMTDESSKNKSETSNLIISPARGSDDTEQFSLVPPPNDKRDEKPIKGILKQPRAKFPEDENPVREGVAPHKEDKKLKDVPSGARWTKINRKIVNPEALTIGKERFELRDDFVIVLRVLDKEEIQAYAAATQLLRERRKNKQNAEKGNELHLGHEHDDDHLHRHRRQRRHFNDDTDDGLDTHDRERDLDRRRRYKRDDRGESEA